MSNPFLLSTLSGLALGMKGCCSDLLIRDMRSSTPTRHRVTILSGLSLHVHCALDALLLPFLLGGEDVAVESVPPGTPASPISFQILRGRLFDAPEGVLVTIPLQRNMGSLRESFCPYSNIFPDSVAYEDWASSVDVPTQALPLSEALGLARDLVAQLKGT